MLNLGQAFAVVFVNNHGFNQWQLGLTFVSIFVGMVIGVSCDVLWKRNCKYKELLEYGIPRADHARPSTRA